MRSPVLSGLELAALSDPLSSQCRRSQAPNVPRPDARGTRRETLELGLEDATAVLRLPEKYRRRLCTTNMVERLIQEVHRQEKVIRIFPNDDSAWRLIGAFLAERHEEWSTRRKYLTMDEYCEADARESEVSDVRPMAAEGACELDRSRDGVTQNPEPDRADCCRAIANGKSIGLRLLVHWVRLESVTEGKGRRFRSHVQSQPPNQFFRWLDKQLPDSKGRGARSHNRPAHNKLLELPNNR